jgi:hypothetical protein
MARLLKEALWTVLAALILAQVMIMASVAVFPMGGGEYHAIFAYTETGRLGAALKAYGTYLLSLAVPAGLLVWSGYPARWWLVASVAAAVGLLAWWGICTWEPQGIGFHTAVIALLPGFPAVLFGVCWVAARRSARRRVRGTDPAA